MFDLLEKAQDALPEPRDHARAQDVLKIALSGQLGPIAMVSSFGADSAVLLHMVAQINPRTPVIFIDTAYLFKETLEYQKTLARALGLENIIVAGPDAAQLRAEDTDGMLHHTNADRCCQIRKADPLNKALEGYAGWITGRKRYQSKSRQNIEFFEIDQTGIKVNPLIHWSHEDLRNYFVEHNLPSHPLVAKGYPSIGCAPCTRRVRAGEDPRAGRWPGQQKTECGIHFENGAIVRPEQRN